MTMRILRWWLWFYWHVWLELRQRWYCWRNGVVRLAQSVRVHSVTWSGQELLLGRCSLPGTSFGECDLTPCYGPRLVPGGEISLEVENLSNRPLPFQGAVFAHDQHGSTIHPFPTTLLGPRQTARVSVRMMGSGKLDRIFIPTHVKRTNA